MEHITDITLPAESGDTQYKVLFHDELYTFEPQNGNTSPAFSIRRIHNEWIPEDSHNDALVKQAIEKLDAYLLSQH